MRKVALAGFNCPSLWMSHKSITLFSLWVHSSFRARFAVPGEAPRGTRKMMALEAGIFTSIGERLSIVKEYAKPGGSGEPTK